jgi:tetratricopeptide (TPR) repeat protein
LIGSGPFRAAAFAAVLVSGAAVSGAGERGDREAAIAALLARSGQTSPGSEQARALAAEMGMLGERLLAEGEFGAAIELLGEAHGLDDRNGLVLGQLTLAYVRAEDFGSARFYLARAETGGRDSPPEIYRTLGDAYQELHRLEDAAAAWSEAARQSGQDPAILTRLARVRDEIAISRGQRVFATDHFEIFADPVVPEAELSRAAAGLELSYAALAETLGTRLDRPQVVVIHAGRHYFSLVAVPDWVAGLYDGKIRVAVDPGWDPHPAASSVLAHELGHAMLRHASGDRAPAWLHEGFAQWSEGRRLPRRDLPAALAGAHAASSRASASASASVVELEASLRGPLDRRAARAAYARTLSLVEHLIRLRGDGALTCIVARLREGEAFEDALRAETGMNEEELYESWKGWAGL